MLDIVFAQPAMPASGALALLIAEGAALSGLAMAADAATSGALTRAFEAAKFTGKKGSSCTVLAPGAGLSRVVAVGLGQAEQMTAFSIEEAGGTAAGALAGEEDALLAADILHPAQAAAAAMGAVLRHYRFDRYRTKEKPEDKPKLTALTVLTTDLAAAEAAWEPLHAVAKGVFLSRDLISEPPNVLFPAELADRCLALEALGVKVEVFGPKEMTKLGFGMLMGVSLGSATEPRMVVMRWDGASKALAGRARAKRRRRSSSRWRSSARASPSTPAASASNRPAAWRT